MLLESLTPWLLFTYFIGDLNGEPEEPDVALTLPARGTWATRGIVEPAKVCLVVMRCGVRDTCR
jgi:hypothetical protein